MCDREPCPDPLFHDLLAEAYAAQPRTFIDIYRDWQTVDLIDRQIVLRNGDTFTVEWTHTISAD